MKRILKVMTVAILGLSFMSSCSQINDLKERVDKLEGENASQSVTIASISDQVAGINSSIKTLQDAKSAIDTKIAELKTADGNFTKQIEALTTQSEAIGKRIEELVAFATTEIVKFAKTEWVAATFATLEEYNKTCETLAALKQTVEELGPQVAEDIKEAIASSEESLKTWISTQLEGYYTIAQVDAKVNSILVLLDSMKVISIDGEEIPTIEEVVSSTKEDIDSLKAEITEAYMKAISDAINAIPQDSTVTAAIASIAEINEKVAAMEEAVTALEEAVTGLTNRVLNLENMIQSVTYIPDFSDGIARIPYDYSSSSVLEFKDLVLDFELTPKNGSAKTLASAFIFNRGIVTVDATTSFNATKANSILTLPVKAVFAKDTTNNVISVVVDKYVLSNPKLVDVLVPYSGRTQNPYSLSLGLHIQTEATDILSNYFTAQADNNDDIFELETHEVYENFRDAVTKYEPYFTALFNFCGDDVLCGTVQKGYFDYGFGYGFFNYNYVSDDFNDLSNFRYNRNNQVVETVYKGIYETINVFDKYLKKWNDESHSRTQGIAEARVLRAWLYMYLAMGWNKPIFVSGDGAPYQMESQEAMLNWCITECSESVAYLPSRLTENDKESIYHATKAFANTLIGKMYLYEGRYAAAVLALGNVVVVSGAANYSLVPSNRYEELFHVEGDANEEKIFEIRPSVNIVQSSDRNSIWNWHSASFVADPLAVYSGNVNGQGRIGVPQWFGEAFYEHDNNGKTPRFKASLIRVSDAVDGGEPFKYASSNLSSKDSAELMTSELVGLRTPLENQSLYLPVKQITRANDYDATGIRRANITLMRYAEPVLLYAEALCAEGGIINKATARNVFNAFRLKRGLSTFRSSITSAELLEEVKQEELFEFWFEGSRWINMVRWANNDDTEVMNRAKEEGTTTSILCDSKFKNPGASDEVVWENTDDTDSRFYLITNTKYSESSTGFKKNKHEYFPFPAYAFYQCPGFTQNPGW